MCLAVRLSLSLIWFKLPTLTLRKLAAKRVFTSRGGTLAAGAQLVTRTGRRGQGGGRPRAQRGRGRSLGRTKEQKATRNKGVEF